MNAAAVLYTPEVLALATRLADFPLDDSFTNRVTTRSPLCGSEVTLGLDVDATGAVTRLGLAARACAVGQAAAAVFANHATGLTMGEIAAGELEVKRWLAGEGPLPGWPGFSALAAAQAYPARHGAILLAWKAAGSLAEAEG